MLEGINVTLIQGGTTNDHPTLLALIAAKNGIAFVPASVRHFLPKGGKTYFIRINAIGMGYCSSVE